MQTTILAGLLLLALSLSAQAGQKGKHATTPQTFTVAAGATISVEGNKSATLADIKVGDHVKIAYTEANGALTAVHIKDVGPNPVKHAKKAKSGGKHHKHTSTNLHARGIVQSVDAANQTLTITVKHKHHKAP